MVAPMVVRLGLIHISGDDVENTPRCGHPDAYTVAGKWLEPPLTYQVRNTVKPYTKKRMWEIVKECLGEWAYWAPRLQFLPVIAKTEKVDLHFEFLSGDHGDGAPFDGPGAVLAHAFIPNSQEEHFLEGDVHFDKVQPWGEWLDLKTVCLHEIGHALGLGHSDVQGAVMYPYYQGRIHQLQTDDAEAIAALYRK